MTLGGHGQQRGLSNRVLPAEFERLFRNAGLYCELDLQGGHSILVCRLLLKC